MSHNKNTDITVIIPLHELNGEIQTKLLNAINSVITNTHNIINNVKTLFVCTPAIQNDLTIFLNNLNVDFNNYLVVVNEGDSDYCSQINYAVDFVDTEWFSILEYDDMYTSYWFKSFNEYFYTNEDVSLFLPINVQYEESTPNIRQFCNEIVWANEFSKEMGYIDFECLDNFYGFNLTGGIFNKADFIKIGKFKPSIEVAFNYEFLLRLTHKHLKVLVIPKEGYIHCLNRENSLSYKYLKNLTEKEIELWFGVAKSEYPYTKDRKTKITQNVELLK